MRWKKIEFYGQMVGMYVASVVCVECQTSVMWMTNLNKNT